MTRLSAWALNACYVLAVVLASPLIALAAVTKGKYRDGYSEKLLGLVPQRTGDAPCIWLHAVSVGEVNLLATTLSEIRARRPDVDVVISTTTKTGYELATRKYGDCHTVFYCPLDFSWAVRRAMSRIRPNLLVLAELELWPNLIAAAKDHGAKVAIINGRLSDSSFRGYRRLSWLVSKVLAKIDVIAAQDETTADRFRQLSRSMTRPCAEQIVVSGSLKYDGAETNCHNARTESLRQLAGFQSDNVVWLVGSTQAPEEEMVVRIFAELSRQHANLRLVIVPRHPERFDEVARLLECGSLDWRRRSELSQPAASSPQILLVDSVGELGAWWGAATVGFVGGTFGDRGGQNMIEPAAYGVATCFGPNTWNFRDIVAALLAAEGAQVVATEAELRDFVAHCLDNPAYAAALGARAKAFVATQLGATARTVDLLEGLLPTARGESQAAA